MIKLLQCCKYEMGGSGGIYDEELAFLSAQKPEAEAPGVERVTADGYFKVFPNPTNGEITIEYNKPGILTLNDAIGRTVYTVALPEGKNKLTLVLPKLTPGVYVYHYLVNGKQTQTGKLVFTK